MYTVPLWKLLKNEEAAKEIDRALSTYPLYVQQEKEEKVVGLIPTREKLNKKILNHFKYREIGFETVGRFLDELEIAMCEIMPYYNQMFRTVDIMNAIDDPFGNVDFTETITEKRTSESSSAGNTSSNATSETESSGTSNNIRKESDTPGNRVDDIDNYLSSAGTDSGQSASETKNETSGTSQSSDSSHGSSDFEHILTKKGNQGVNTYAHDIKELRGAILNVEKMIIADDRLQELFLMIY